MQDEVRRRFCGRNIGGVDDDLPPDLITGLYGIAVVPAMFGQTITYFDSKWPQPQGEHLTDEQADALEPEEVDNNELFQNILSQIDRIEELTGSARGYLNWQGVLNTAFRLRGERIFMDLFDTPERAHHIFECVTNAMIEGIKKLHERQKKAGVDEKFATISNCVVNMISPEHYKEYVLPYDLKIRAEFDKFGIHNCAWVVDPYMDSYATVPRLGYIDMGVTSDMKRAKELFPETRRTVLYTSMDLVNKSKEEIHSDFERIANEIAPCDVGLPDIETDVPDERVMYAMDLCEEMSQKYGE
jgi:uroporphyrinogen-III decarboxylase